MFSGTGCPRIAEQLARKALRLSSALLLSIFPLTIAMPGCMAGDDGDVDEEEPEETSGEALSTFNCAASSTTGYSRGNPTSITVVRVDGKPVERATANAYIVMAKAAERDGVQIRINSGFRTMEEQEYFYACYKNCNCNSCNLAAKPGHSNHQSGHALDLNTRDPKVFEWLTKHGAEYGFKRTVPSEPWHWEWWGGGPGGGPCNGGNAGNSGCHSATVGKQMPENACVQSRSDREWYQCSGGNWLARRTVRDACVSEHPL